MKVVIEQTNGNAVQLLAHAGEGRQISRCGAYERLAIAVRVIGLHDLEDNLEHHRWQRGNASL